MSPNAQAYEKHKNLKIAAAELGIPWQTLYVRLKREGVAVSGDKARYGNDKDRLAAWAEAEFQRLVPMAVNMNDAEWQAKHDFEIAGVKVDVKSSMPRQLNKRFPGKSWSFSFKKQSMTCDFICCFCLRDDRSLAHLLVVPQEFFRGIQTVSVSCAGNSKWLDYAIPADQLSEFFSSLIN